MSTSTQQEDMKTLKQLALSIAVMAAMTVAFIVTANILF